MQGVSYCKVDAAGTLAEWAETTVATVDQLTIVYFVGGECGTDALDEKSRQSAGALAAATGARVLTAACSSHGGRLSHTVAVERGLAAYVWLLGEGCDPELTAFVYDSGDAALVEAILVATEREGLPVPAGGVWPVIPRLLSEP